MPYATEFEYINVPPVSNIRIVPARHGYYVECWQGDCLTCYQWAEDRHKADTLADRMRKAHPVH